MKIFARTLMVIVNGEISQMFKSKGVASRDDYYRRIYAKTASVFEAATESGAVVGGATEDEVAALAVYGREVGSAFQIVDDILDFVSDEAHLGKPVGGDLRQGLITLPTLYYLEERPDDRDLRDLLDGHMGDAAIAARAVEAVRNSAAIRASLAEAREFAQRGIAALDILPGGLHTDSLREIAEYVVSRDL
jgi:geranylgeranyl pyrophosphate synthase